MTNNFYYDEVMNEDLTTFSIYLYSPGIEGLNKVDRSYEYGTEILRGIISQDASMGSHIIWNGSPLNLSSAWANLTMNLKSATRNLTNVANSVKNIGTTLKGTGIMNWNQDAYYSINEFQKTFGGITTSTPLSISAMILPYIDEDNIYHSVKDQLTKFLNRIYEGEKYLSNDDLKNDGFEKTESENTTTEPGNNTTESNSWMKLLDTIGGWLSTGLDWFIDKMKAVNEFLDGDSKYIITLKPPHGYDGVPTDYLEGKWMANTLAIRIGNRQLYNLLISTINVTVSKEHIVYYGEFSPAHAQVDLSFQPVLVFKPSEIRKYILEDNTPTSTSVNNIKVDKNTV